MWVNLLKSIYGDYSIFLPIIISLTSVIIFGFIIYAYFHFCFCRFSIFRWRPQELAALGAYAVRYKNTVDRVIVPYELVFKFCATYLRIFVPMWLLKYLHTYVPIFLHFCLNSNAYLPTCSSIYLPTYLLTFLYNLHVNVNTSKPGFANSSCEQPEQLQSSETGVGCRLSILYGHCDISSPIPLPATISDFQYQSSFESIE